MSPILFALYLSNMANYLALAGQGFMVLNVRLNGLLFPDDIVCFAGMSLDVSAGVSGCSGRSSNGGMKSLELEGIKKLSIKEKIEGYMEDLSWENQSSSEECKVAIEDEKIEDRKRAVPKGKMVQPKDVEYESQVQVQVKRKKTVGHRSFKRARVIEVDEDGNWMQQKIVKDEEEKEQKEVGSEKDELFNKSAIAKFLTPECADMMQHVHQEEHQNMGKFAAKHLPRPGKNVAAVFAGLPKADTRFWRVEQHQAKLSPDRPSDGQKKAGRRDFPVSAVGPDKADSRGLAAGMQRAQLSQVGCRGVSLPDSTQPGSKPQQKKNVGTLLTQDIRKYLVKQKKN